MTCHGRTTGRWGGHAAVAALTVLGLLTSSAPGLAEPCTEAGDCSGEESCVEGECVAEAPTDNEERSSETQPADVDGEAAGEAGAAPEAPAANDGEGNPNMVGAGIGLLGVGVLGVGIGIGAIVGGASNSREYVVANATGTTQPNEAGFPDASDGGLQITGGIVLGIGGAMAITGAILIPVGVYRSPTPDDEALIIEPLLAPTYAGVRVRF